MTKYVVFLKVVLGLSSVILMFLAVYSFITGDTSNSFLFTLWALLAIIVEGKL